MRSCEPPVERLPGGGWRMEIPGGARVGYQVPESVFSRAAWFCKVVRVRSGNGIVYFGQAVVGKFAVDDQVHDIDEIGCRFVQGRAG